ncbi:APC family permease [Oleiagrimonas sp. C23AA]|uniref:amino acid permease n=1 Tax=Oleiagrimonas sp. C23AA TaxID=2719047 RepID=UPI0019800C0A
MSQQAGRSVGLWGAIAIGVGGMVGGGIFAVLGEAVSIAHGATPLAFLAGGLLAWLTALAYAHLSVAFPSRGGTVVFIDQAFGNNLLSGSVNLMLWLSYLVTIALYATAFASYAETFFASPRAPWLHHVLITAAIALPMLINIANAGLVSRSETAIVGLKVALIALVIVASAPYVKLGPMTATPPSAWGAAIPAGLIIFVAYEGFELIANSAEDITAPSRTLPRAFMACVLFVVALYVLIAVITVGTVPEAQLLKAKDYVLAVAAEPALGHAGFIIVALAALLATFSAINATIYGTARLGYVLAKDGQLPQRFARQRASTPVTGVIATALIAMVLANLIDLTDIAIIGSASFLLVFALVGASAWRLRARIGGPSWVYALGALSCAGALVVLLIHTWRGNAFGVVVFAAFALISLLFEWLYGRYVRGHFLGRAYVGSDDAAA